MTAFRLFVPGIPVPQGSKIASRTGTKIVLREANKRLPQWRKDLAAAIHLHRMETDTPPIRSAAVVQYEFLMPRPKTVTRKHMTVKPDLDKLARAVNDACTDAQLMADDSLIISLNLNKRYAVPELDEEPGVHISVWAVNE